MKEIDVAIIGGGPAGMQAALVLARTRKDTVVFDAPSPPRNAASHGVHNFLGLDGMLPHEIRDRAWEQIDAYDSARLIPEAVTAVRRADESNDLVVATPTGEYQARQVILTCGYHDQHPDLDGFDECWANTIISCPFCDGFENKDRVWGIVPSMSYALDVFPHMVQSWTDKRMVLAPRHLTVSSQQKEDLERQGVALHHGDIVELHHNAGKLRAVTLDDGQRIEVGTLLVTPDERAAPLIDGLTDTLGLALDEHGYVTVDNSQKTNVSGLWAAGDVQGTMGAIASANAGSVAASMIVHGWFETDADEGAT